MFNSKFLGVLKHPGYNGKSDAPPAPDYTGAANATAAGNLEAARATAAANRTNQVTPYGNLTYTANPGTDPYGNTLYTATQTLAPAQQAILDQQNQLNQGLMQTANTGLNYANSILSQPGVDTSKLPSYGIDPGQSYSDAIMARLSPQIAQEREMSDAQLANQGIAQGTEAYTNAKRQLAQNQNDRQLAAVTAGMNTGLTANQQAFNQQAYNQMQPINVINALRTGSQVQNPSFASTPMQASTGGADILGATQAGYNAQLGATNAQNAASGNFMGGLMNLGGLAILKSDERLKENIKKVGSLDNGLNLYSYNYKDGYNLPEGKQVGVLAQEVEKVIPEAVVEMDDGFKSVNYAMLGI
jgi:Chaperone of endosialidase